MAPLENTRVIPPGWEAHHSPVSEDAMTAACAITRAPMAGTYNETARRTEYPAAWTVFTGICRVTPSSASRGHQEPIVGDQAKPLRTYEVEVPLDCPRVLIGDQVEITAATDDDFVGRLLQVTSYPGGSLAWDRNLVCREAQPAGR